MTLLNIFSWCSSCSLWLLPLLFGAWALGYLLWKWTAGKRLNGEIEDLRGNIKNWKTKFNDTEKELSQVRYDEEKLNGEYSTLKTRFANNDARYRTLETKYNDMEAQGIASIDTSKWTDRIVDLESQLDISRNTNLKLQGDYATLKSKFSEVQEQVSEGTALGIASGGADLSRVTDLEKALETSDSNYRELEASYHLLRANMEEMKTQQSKKGAVSDDVENYQARIADLEKELNTVSTNYTTLLEELEAQLSEKKIDESSNLENYEARIEDLEKKLALSYESNTQMETDYAHLKSNFGEMQMRLQDAPVDNSIELEGYQIRIAELEQQLASQSEEESAAPGEAKKKKKKKKSKNKKKDKKKKSKKKSKKVKSKSRGKKTGYGLVFEENNLQIVEGIGPKIEGLLKEAGVDTWAKLGNAEVAQLKEIMEAAGPRYKMHDPSTWAQQAILAEQGDWNEMVALQKVIGGAEGQITDSKVEKLYLKAIGFKSLKENDLKVVEGIGPKIEELLKNAGFDTWKKLSKAKVDEIQAVLDDAGSRYKMHDPGTWAKQAKMADDSDWQTLKTYQDELDGGKE